MEEGTIIALIGVAIILIFAIIAISLIIWLEKTKSLFIRFAIIVSIEISIMIYTLQNIIKYIESGRTFLAILEITFFVGSLIFCIIYLIVLYKNKDSKLSKLIRLIKEIVDEDNDHKKNKS